MYKRVWKKQQLEQTTKYCIGIRINYYEII